MLIRIALVLGVEIQHLPQGVDLGSSCLGSEVGVAHRRLHVLVAKTLGHSTLAVTMRYAHFAPEAGRVAVRRLGDLLASATVPLPRDVGRGAWPPSWTRRTVPLRVTSRPLGSVSAGPGRALLGARLM